MVYMWKEDSILEINTAPMRTSILSQTTIIECFSVSWNDIASYPGLPRTRENRRGKAKLFRECGEGLGMRLGRVYGVANTGCLASYILCTGSYASPTSSKMERAPLGFAVYTSMKRKYLNNYNTTPHPSSNE